MSVGHTGPDFTVEQGAVKDWDLTVSPAQPTANTAVLRVGRRASNRSEYATAVTQDCEIDGNTVDVSLDTAELSGLEYLWQVDLLDANGHLLQRWRGLLLVIGSLP